MSWVAIPGFVGEYAVSDEGRVMSMNFAKSGLPGILNPMTRRGYQSVMLRRKWHTVHSLVATAFIGPRPDGMEINHKDGVKTNNAAGNLEYVTHSENAKHACRLYLIDNRGEKHSRSRLTETQVLEIISHLHAGKRQCDLARDYGVDPSQVSHIKRGRSWPHLSRKAG